MKAVLRNSSLLALACVGVLGAWANPAKATETCGTVESYEITNEVAVDIFKIKLQSSDGTEQFFNYPRASGRGGPSNCETLVLLALQDAKNHQRQVCLNRIMYADYCPAYSIRVQ